MNLVSFAAVTAGGLVCELLNNTTTEIGLNGTYNSFQHNLMKNNSFFVIARDDKHQHVINTSIVCKIVYKCLCL